ncbi:hypothetical protein MPER_07954 [Moniliophthora perniciosa FA553]|nr:hypothetical protein MPER_07954 [Moniliophthora perniciosa FA553]
MAPYSSASNGAGERTIGVVLQSIRSMLLDSRLSAKWWAHAMKTATHTVNLFPSTREPSRVPEEAWTGQRQTAEYLVPFGSIRFAHIPKETGRGKLDPQGEKVVMVGYDGNGVYLVKQWESDLVEHVRDVVWIKDGGHWVEEAGLAKEDLSFLEEISDDEVTGLEAGGIGPTTPEATRLRTSPLFPEEPAASDLPADSQHQQTRRMQEEIWGTEPTRCTTREQLRSLLIC